MSTKKIPQTTIIILAIIGFIFLIRINDMLNSNLPPEVEPPGYLPPVPPEEEVDEKKEDTEKLCYKSCKRWINTMADRYSSLQQSYSMNRATLNIATSDEVERRDTRMRYLQEYIMDLDKLRGDLENEVQSNKENVYGTEPSEGCDCSNSMIISNIGKNYNSMLGEIKGKIRSYSLDLQHGNY